jgi:DNA-binding IclR family transcriptional regulator
MDAGPKAGRAAGAAGGPMTGLPLYLSDALDAGLQPCPAEIARALGLNLSTVRGIIRRLTRAGVVQVERRSTGRGGSKVVRVVRVRARQGTE